MAEKTRKVKSITDSRSRPAFSPSQDENGAKRHPIRRARTAYLLAVVSALGLALAFPPTEISWLAYVAPVPLLAMAVGAASRRHVFWAAYVGGLVFFGLGLSWVIPIKFPLTLLGWAALVAYLALYWAVFAWGTRRIGEAVRIPLALLAPALWVALEYLRGWLLTGLPWLYLGHTQYENPTLIQTADALGTYGPSFLAMMTAGFLTALLSRPLFVAREGPGAKGPRRLNRTILVCAGLIAAVWAATVGYGLWRLGQRTRRPGPVVATIQTSVPQRVKTEARGKRDVDAEQKMLETQVRLTGEVLASARAEGLSPDLVVWPETMVPGILSRSFLEANLVSPGERAFKDDQARFRTYWEKVRETAREAGAPVLCGASDIHYRGVRYVGDEYVALRGMSRNAAFLIAPDSPAYISEHTYAKVHLVPFGEYVPFKETAPWLHDLLLKLTPRGYHYNLSAGSPNQEPFVVKFADAAARFQVAICYEDAFAYRIREMVRPRKTSGGKAIDFLVNISNDGWFARPMSADAPGLKQSTEHKQHLNLCVFRAVENRIPVVRSVNTGISAIITSDGRIADAAEGADLERGNLEGFAVGRIELDERLAPYTRVGDAFARACLAASAGLGIAAAIAVRFRQK